MARVRIKMNPTQKILLKRSLNKNGEAQVFFTKECAKAFNNYVPYDTGRLKDMMVTLKSSSIIYSAPYAKKRYYRTSGLGKQGTRRGGKRGRLWDKRCWVVEGNNIAKSVADFVGGRSK